MENKYQETIIRFKAYKELTDDISKLEKALDKACELLSKNVTKRVHYVDGYAVFGNGEPEKTREQWKEWLLKDE